LYKFVLLLQKNRTEQFIYINTNNSLIINLHIWHTNKRNNMRTNKRTALISCKALRKFF